MSDTKTTPLDEHGYAVDPTKNVIALSEASNKRQDDLRQAHELYSKAAIEHMRELSRAENDHVKELANIRADYQKQLSEAEAKRIDAIRAVDVNAVAVASERQAAAATVLANQVAQSADALRTLVATTATALGEQQRQSLTQITDRLTVVERSQYEGRGKQLVEDPRLLEMLAEVKVLRETSSAGAGKSAGIGSVGVIVAGTISAISTLLAIVGVLYGVLK